MSIAPDQLPSRPTIGIITALPKEYAAVKAILEHPQEVMAAGAGAGRRSLIGEISAPGGIHYVVLSLAAMGNNSAAIRAGQLLQQFPNVRSLVMVGIAGGVPHPQKPAEHVRLGDIVVSDERGVVQYDFDKETTALIEHRHYPRPPSPVLLEAVRHLEVAEVEGKCPWVDQIKQLQKKLHIDRPAPDTDVLFSSDDPPQRIDHPIESQRNTRCKPRVFHGPIASANKLLKNPRKRDALRDRFAVKAVEMESSGIADATWNHEVGYLVVRGICDYCDAHKNDTWQEYAALAAAGYTRTLIESMPLQQPHTRQRALVVATGLVAIVITILILMRYLSSVNALLTAGLVTPSPSVPETPTHPTGIPNVSPTGIALPSQTAPSDALPPIDWGGLDTLFTITDLKVEHHRRVSSAGGGVNFVDNAATFIVEAKSDFLLTFCRVSFFDNDHIQVDSPSIISFDPDLVSWKKGDRSRGLIILPVDMPQVRMITVEC